MSQEYQELVKKDQELLLIFLQTGFSNESRSFNGSQNEGNQIIRNSISSQANAEKISQNNNEMTPGQPESRSRPKNLKIQTRFIQNFRDFKFLCFILQSQVQYIFNSMMLIFKQEALNIEPSEKLKQEIFILTKFQTQAQNARKIVDSFQTAKKQWKFEELDYQTLLGDLYQNDVDLSYLIQRFKNNQQRNPSAQQIFFLAVLAIFQKQLLIQKVFSFLKEHKTDIITKLNFVMMRIQNLVQARRKQKRRKNAKIKKFCQRGGILTQNELFFGCQNQLLVTKRIKHINKRQNNYHEIQIHQFQQEQTPQQSGSHFQGQMQLQGELNEGQKKYVQQIEEGQLTEAQRQDTMKRFVNYLSASYLYTRRAQLL